MTRAIAVGLIVLPVVLSASTAALGQTTVRINLGPGGIQTTGGHSYFPAISADGRHVAFMSRATNLYAGASGYQVYAHDRDPDGNTLFDEGNGVTTLMSLGIDGLPGNGSQGGFNGNFGVSISASGRHVMWSSQSINLVAGDTTGLPAYDVFVRDRDPDADGIYDEADAYNIRVNIGPGNAQSNSFDNGNDRMSISDDGLMPVFSSGATNLTGAPDTNSGVDIFMHDLSTSTTVRISELPGGMEGPSGTNKRISVISGNGRYVAFWANPLWYTGSMSGPQNFYIKDRLTGAVVPGSVGSAGLAGNGDIYSIIWGNDQGPSLSNDGRFFAFTSFASNFDAGDTNGTIDVFMNDRDPDENGVFDEGNNITVLLSKNAGGAGGNMSSGSAVMSGDGQFVTFSSFANNLVPGDTNSAQDVFMRDRLAGTIERVSLAADGAQSNAASYLSDISENGRFVAFYSGGNNLVTGDTNGQIDVFVRDRGLALTAGDMNCDGHRDGLDIAGFALAMLNSAQYAIDYPACNILNGDFTADTIVDLADLPGFTYCILGLTCP